MNVDGRKSRIGAVLVLLQLVCGCGSSDTSAPTSSNTGKRTMDEADLRGQVRTRYDSPDPTAAQLTRRANSIEIIQQLNLPYIEHLPVVEDAADLTPRSSDEIAHRCLATLICAVKGESDDHQLAQDLVERFSVGEYFSPAERAFIDSPQTSEQDRIDFAWRYECLHVFLWALGYLDELNPPHEICDVPGNVGIIREAGAESFIAEARARPIDDVLDANDFYYRLHWAVIELRLKGESSEAANEEIISERHRALNWLIRYMNQDWDDVSTDT